jgi:asparagine synthase (glutamine-hydrolysing)
MCGICGTYEYQKRQPVEREVLSDMLKVLRHRGPDDEGVYVDRHLAIGMRRLSIIDLVGGKQPISNEDGSVVVVFNGEIYNYRELREALTARGHRFSTNGDTEVIVHLYEESGDRCVDSLRGMFAFALWDKAKQRLFLARDRLGIKPLYYLERKGALVFGSEIKAILQHPDAEARLDREALSHYLSLKYVPAPHTMFAEIRALPPGHSLTCDSNGFRIREYWQLSFAPNHNHHSSEGECTEQLEALLRESVRLHLMSDVPFGAFLSGGVDSSTIVALMSQMMEKPVKTFSVGFIGEGSSFSELPYARLVAEHCQTDHHEVLVRPADLVDLAEKVIWHLDQPIADNACLANYLLSELAVSKVKMVLTGEGGDELFAGYARYAGERLSPWFQRVPRPLLALARNVAGKLPGLRRPKLALFALCQPEESTRLTSWFPLFNHEMKLQLLSDDFKASLAEVQSDSVFAAHLSRTDAVDPLNRMLYVDTKLWLPDDLLARGDKMSMAASLEARVPLLDHKLVEFAATLPPQFKLRRLMRKYLLKNVARRWLPSEIIDRKKEGFPMPFSVWFRKEARSFVRDLLSPSVTRRRGLFNVEYVQKLLDQHESGTADHAALLWGLLSVELWHRAFLDSPPASQRLSSSFSVVV